MVERDDEYYTKLAEKVKKKDKSPLISKEPSSRAKSFKDMDDFLLDEPLRCSVKVEDKLDKVPEHKFGTFKYPNGKSPDKAKKKTGLHSPFHTAFTNIAKKDEKFERPQLNKSK